MPYEVIKRKDKFLVKKVGDPDKVFGEHNTREEAELQIYAIETSEGKNKSIEIEGNLLDLTNGNTYDIIDGDGKIKVEGYLFRYSDKEKPSDRDLHNQFWSKDTYLMTETFPVKGIPIMYGHSLKDEFVKVGIGVVTYAEEDDIGLFIKGELHDREKWFKIVEEVNRRRGLGLSRKQIEDLAVKGFENIKSVVKNVPLQWSMGSYPPTYKVDKSSGKIERAGIVEATLTPVPAEPNGTDVAVSFKSFVDFLTMREPSAVELKDSERQKTEPNLTKYTKSQDKTKMDGMEEKPKLNKEDRMKAAFGSFAKEMAAIMAEEAEKQMEIEVDEKEEEEMKSIVTKNIESFASKDTGFKKAIEDGDMDSIKSVVAAIVKTNGSDIIRQSVEQYLDAKVEARDSYKKSMSDSFEKYKSELNKEAPKSGRTGNYQGDESETRKGMRIESIKTIEPSLGDFFRDVYYGRSSHTDYTKSMKAQNPYIGTLGGVLTGQEMAQNILDPLRPEVVTFGMGVTETRVNNIGIYTRPKMTTTPNAYRPGINTQITETEAKYETITAMLRPLAARVVIPRQMLMTTGTNMEQQLKNEIIRSLRLQIDKEILEGVGAVSGTGNTGAQIFGIKRVLAASPVASTNLVTLGTGNGAKPKYDDLINAETRIAEGNVELDQSTSGWIMHPRDRGTFRRTVGTDGHPLLYPNYSDRPYEDLIGYRVATTTQVSNNQTVGTSTDCSDIYFGNWRYGEYVIGNDVEVILDDMTLADQLQVRFIVYLYSDFIVHYPEAFYVMQGVRA